MKKSILVLLAATAFAATAGAQQVSTFSFEQKASTDGQRVVLDKVVAEQGVRVAVEKRAVTNAPYSAEAVNESIQVLQDGNRIVHRTTTRVYRDSAGRTRRETMDENGQVTMVMVNDPAAGTAYVFDPRSNTVRSSTMRVREGVSVGGVGGSVVIGSGEKRQIESAVAGAQAVIRERVPATGGGGGGGVAGGFVYAPSTRGETTKEDLGQQTIEGVTATGTRTTTVIPAGAIGNEQPIKIVSEEWTSPELQVLVMTKHSDPRTGETTYRLTGITRTEPPASLFEAPVKK